MLNDLLEALDHERAVRTAALGFDLLPCPFCGGAPYVEHNDDFDVDYIQCDCGTAYSGDDLARWNARVSGKSCAH